MPLFAGVEGIYIYWRYPHLPLNATYLTSTQPRRCQFSEYRTLEDVLQIRTRNHGMVLVGLLLASVLELLSIIRNFRMSVNLVLDIMAVKLVLLSLSDQSDTTGSSWLDRCITANRQRPMKAFIS